jgi:aryl-alcohol dehydrogenase-like predicted oxidoreductase
MAMPQQPAPNAAASGTFLLGGALPIHRLGFGAMRITGPGIWGEPQDRGEALATVARLPALSVTFIDTADSYGPRVSEPLIREALHPYSDGLVIATKAGLTRPGPDRWVSNGHPEYLIEQARKSRGILGLDRIDLWQLHRIDPRVPRGDQFAAIRELIDTGVIRFAGLSQVSVDDIEAARAVFPVATVQNRYNLGDRVDEDVLDYCEAESIGFIPWRPLGGGSFDREGGPLAKVAKRHRATPGQIALAWLLRRSPVMLPIPGTGKVAHLEENVAAAAIQLTEEDAAEIGRSEK